MTKTELEKRRQKLRKIQAELIGDIQSINDQLSLNPLSEDNRDWVHRALKAKRHKLKELEDVHQQIAEVRTQIGTQYQVLASFHQAAKEYLPCEVFGKIMQAATTTIN